MKNDIIPTELAIRAMRDSGYRNTAYALAELIDNAVQADANLVEVFCLEEVEKVNKRKRRRIIEIAVLDNGSGMSSDTLRMALQFGNGSHLNDRSGIGRFGMGLPNASISQGKRVDVWTWQSGPENAMHCYLDLDEIEKGTLRIVPEPTVQAVPEEWRHKGDGFNTTGTIVVWSKFGDNRLTWKSAKATLSNTEPLVGRMYRKFIDKGDLRVSMTAMDSATSKILFEQEVRCNDPLYLMNVSSTPPPFGTGAMFQKYGAEDEVFDVPYQGKTHRVIVRASWAKPETLPEDGTDRGSKPYGKHAQKNIGVSIVRADRELDLDASWAISYDPTERWWGIEIDFPPSLDEVFGVTNNKQAATVFSHMANFDWTTVADPGEEFAEYKRRISEDGDPRGSLIDVADYIRTTLKQIRSALKDQTKGRRKSGKRHDETSVEDRATTKFKQRAETGHETPSDKEEFNQAAKDALVEDLTEEKQYPSDTAKSIADAVQTRGRKVLFVELANEMDAFFGVESKPGGITEVVFNRNHPAFDSLIRTLDANIDDATDSDLVERIVNASETLKMLLAAWARQEIEDVPNRERLRRMRQDWGRMARDFLDDEEHT